MSDDEDDQALDRVLNWQPPRSVREARRMRDWRRLIKRAADAIREQRRRN